MIDNEDYGYGYIGKVIRIISDKEIIIDVGEDTLTNGDQIQVYAIGDDILDLNGKSLGRYEKIKDTLTVMQTSRSYSVCSKIIKEQSSFTFALTGLSKTVDTIISLDVNGEDIKPLKINDDKTIKPGDLVKTY